MKRLLGLVAAVIVAGPACTVGPDYTRPTITTPDAWYEAHVQGVAEGSAHVQTWWTVFDDRMLDELIHDAQANNLDIQVAFFRIVEARAIRGIVAGDRYPQVDVTAEASTAEPSESTTGLTERVDTFSFGAGLAWEIDLFGRIRRSVEAATAQYEASVEDYRDVLVTLLGDVAINYLDVRTLQARLHYARSNIEAQRESLALTGDRFKAGLTSALDVAQAESNLARSEAEVPALEAGLEAALNRLEVLVGRQPGALHERLADVQPIPLPPDEVAMGLPAELLRQRPDVRRAERELAAQTARIGVATADLYPRLSLTGFFASDAGVFGDVATGKSVTWGIGIPLRWQVFSGGKVQNQIRAEQARADQAFKLYEQSVLLALEEVQTALAAYAQERLRVGQLRRATDATQRAVDLVRTQYISGLTNFQNVLDTQRTLFQLQQELASSEGTRVQSLVDLYRALGGGWDIENPDVTPRPAGLEQDAEAGRVYTILPPSDS
ncbi:MAG: efflux transporter outer membrane subunit [Vicinamibacteria bacterium]